MTNMPAAKLSDAPMSAKLRRHVYGRETSQNSRMIALLFFGVVFVAIYLLMDMK
jgi:hypothetical protein